MWHTLQIMKKQGTNHKSKPKMQNGTVKKLIYDYGYDQGKQDILNKIKYLLEMRKISSLDELAHNIFTLDILSKKDSASIPPLDQLNLEGDIPPDKSHLDANVDASIAPPEEVAAEEVIITNPNTDDIGGKDAIGTGVEKKRGRKRKTFIHAKLTDSRYTVLWDEIYNGDRILVDKYNNAFSYDLTAPKYLGLFTLDGKIDFTIPYNAQ
jgi:hypothetical protein